MKNAVATTALLFLQVCNGIAQTNKIQSQQATLKPSPATASATSKDSLAPKTVKSPGTTISAPNPSQESSSSRSLIVGCSTNLNEAINHKAPLCALKPNRTLDKKFLFAGGALGAAFAFDAYSTVRCSELQPQGGEVNPLLGSRPGPGRTIAIAGSLYAFSMTLDYIWKRGGSKWWWTPLISGTVTHTGSGLYNMGCSRQPQ